MTGAQVLVLPLMLPLLGAVAVAVVPGSRRAARVTFGVAAATLVADIFVLDAVVNRSTQVYPVGGWPPPYGIVLVADRLGATLALLSALVAAASALQTALAGADVTHPRFFHPLFLVMLAGLGGIFLTGDLFNLYVFMEVVVLSSIVLVAIAGRPVSAETTIKYTVLAAIGSAALLGSVAFVYASVGTLNFADVARRVRDGAESPVLSAAAAMMLFAFLLKGAALPFHFWQPDAHSAAPAPVSAMLSGVLVKVGIYGIIRMVVLLFPDTPLMAVLGPIGAATALFGGLAALANTDLKRLLAYSTVSNVGLILLALGWGGPLGLAAALVHTVNHALIKGSLFLLAGYVAERLDEHAMRRLGGLAAIAPAFATAFGLGALGLAGLPPIGGYLSKLTLFQAGLAAGDPILLAAAAIASALGIGYSMRAFVLVFWGETPAWVAEAWTRSDPHSAPIAPLLLVGCVALFGVWPDPLLGLAAATAQELAAPEQYVAAVLGTSP